MSNVLIGIIGVILFIGLALAGALILGSDFQNASDATKASTIVSSVRQVAAAGQMYQVRTGTQIGSERNNSGVSWLIPRFLSSVPNGTPNTYNYGSGKTVVYSEIGLDAKARNICGEVQRSTGQIAATDETMTSTMDLSAAQTRWQTGCVMHSTGLYTVYSAI